MPDHTSGLQRTYAMIFAMSEEEARGRHGIALMGFLDDEFARLGVAATTWGAAHGIGKANLGRWRNGEFDPDLTSLRLIADGLGRPLLDLLIVAAYLPPDVCGDERTIDHVPWPDVKDAIERDRRLSDDDREFLRGAMRVIERGDIGAGGRPDRRRKK